MIRLVLTPGIKNEQEVGWVPSTDTAAWSDRHLGRVILAKYVSEDPGANVYISKGVYADEEITDEISDELIKHANFQKYLIPFASIEIPFFLPDKRPSVMQLTAYPMIWIDKTVIPPKQHGSQNYD